jgi:hypothetical protein
MKRIFTDEQLITAVEASISIRGVLQILGLSPTGCNYKAMYSHFSRLQLDTSHFLGQGHLKGKHHTWNPKRPLSEILVVNSTYTCTSDLKQRLLREGVLENCCYLCGLPPVWQGIPLVLILDHKNGINTDHRLENLRLLCPNCNSQQPTFAGKNRGRYRLAGPPVEEVARMG